MPVQVEGSGNATLFEPFILKGRGYGMEHTVRALS